MLNFNQFTRKSNTRINESLNSIKSEVRSFIQNVMDDISEDGTYTIDGVEYDTYEDDVTDDLKMLFLQNLVDYAIKDIAGESSELMNDAAFKNNIVRKISSENQISTKDNHRRIYYKDEDGKLVNIECSTEFKKPFNINDINVKRAYLEPNNISPKDVVYVFDQNHTLIWKNPNL